MGNAEKNRLLLGPLDVKKAKDGEPVCYEDNDASLISFLDGPDSKNLIAYRTADDRLYTSPSAAFRMAPLTWVEGKPVYKGDVLYSKDGECVTITGVDDECLTSSPVPGVDVMQWTEGYLSWTPPKPAKTTIELTKHEIQSGLDRVRWAEGLIRQLPENHDGRNSWLMNYAQPAQPAPAAAPSEYDRLAKIVQEGRDARDGDADCPYAPKTIESLVHMQGWVIQDLRLALDKARADTTGKTRGFINIYPNARGYRGEYKVMIDGPYPSQSDADNFARTDRVDCVPIEFKISGLSR